MEWNHILQNFIYSYSMLQKISRKCMGGRRSYDEPLSRISPHPNPISNLQMKTNQVGSCFVNVECGLLKSCTTCMGPDLTVTVENNVCRDGAVIPRYNGCEENVCATSRCCKDTISWVVAPSNICDYMWKNHIRWTFVPCMMLNKACRESNACSIGWKRYTIPLL